MAWEVEFTDEFGAWWEELTQEEQDAIDRTVGLLEERGPTLSYPHSSDVKGSRRNLIEEGEIVKENCGEQRSAVSDQSSVFSLD